MKKLTKEILDSVQVGAVATINRDRTPLVTPLHFARLNNKIIWISDRKAQHSVNAFRSGKIDFVVWDNQKRAVYINTEARELPIEERENALEAYATKLGDFMPEFENSQIYEAEIGVLDDNSTTGNWMHYIA